MTTKAVLLDFYGTVARATRWVSADEVLAEHGYELPADAYQRWFNDGIDGMEHDEHSQSRDHYVAWQRERTLAMLAETDVHPGEYEEILTKLRGGAATRTIEAYDESAAVLQALRDRGLRLVICSNWDWDLAEAVERGRPHSPLRRAPVLGLGRRPQAPPAHLRQGVGEAGVEAAEACSSATPGAPTSPARSPRASPRSTCAAPATGPTAPARTTSPRPPACRSSPTSPGSSTSSIGVAVPSGHDEPA